LITIKQKNEQNPFLSMATTVFISKALQLVVCSFSFTIWFCSFLLSSTLFLQDFSHQADETAFVCIGHQKPPLLNSKANSQSLLDLISQQLLTELSFPSSLVQLDSQIPTVSWVCPTSLACHSPSLLLLALS
jgi:hypothetical protein